MLKRRPEYKTGSVLSCTIKKLIKIGSLSLNIETECQVQLKLSISARNGQNTVWGKRDRCMALLWKHRKLVVSLMTIWRLQQHIWQQLIAMRTCLWIISSFRFLQYQRDTVRYVCTLQTESANAQKYKVKSLQCAVVEFWSSPNREICSSTIDKTILYILEKLSLFQLVQFTKQIALGDRSLDEMQTILEIFQ